LKGVSNIWVASISSYANGEEIAECFAKTQFNFIWNSTKNAAQITLN